MEVTSEHLVLKHLLDCYGPLLDFDALGDLYGVGRRTVEHWYTTGSMPVRTTKVGAKRFASSAEVARVLVR